VPLSKAERTIDAFSLSDARGGIWRDRGARESVALERSAYKHVSPLQKLSIARWKFAAA
jgi:hypothetical protein